MAKKNIYEIRYKQIDDENNSSENDNIYYSSDFVKANSKKNARDIFYDKNSSSTELIGIKKSLYRNVDTIN